MPSSLRERKRDRTRQALVDAAADLFARNGYDGTSVADIAAAADIGTRTFFSYFASKEEVLFPVSDGRVQAALDAIATRAPDERPVDVLMRGLDTVGAAPQKAGPDKTGDMVDRVAALRVHLIQTVPAVRSRALQIQFEAQREIAGHLQRAFPGELDPVTAGALVGAFIGAISGALQVLLENPDALGDPGDLRRQLHHATDVALRPWR